MSSLDDIVSGILNENENENENENDLSPIPLQPMPRPGVLQRKQDAFDRGGVRLSPPDEPSVGDMMVSLLYYMDENMDETDPEVRKRLETILDKLEDIADPAARSPNSEVRELGKILQVNF
jgi:hypothetical protein